MGQAGLTFLEPCIALPLPSRRCGTVFCPAPSQFRTPFQPNDLPVVGDPYPFPPSSPPPDDLPILEPYRWVGPCVACQPRRGRVLVAERDLRKVHHPYALGAHRPAPRVGHRVQRGQLLPRRWPERVDPRGLEGHVPWPRLLHARQGACHSRPEMGGRERGGYGGGWHSQLKRANWQQVHPGRACYMPGSARPSSFEMVWAGERGRRICMERVGGPRVHFGSASYMSSKVRRSWVVMVGRRQRL
eukprot:359306-Chlamydomonas_euryale.AAC.3